ncbi:Ribosomal RNA processing protein [Penicillium cf. griseofulvum]|uniref:Ribosomal RNA processing protein n=1 Tax=Penicillium cf. griseofulvum TaxID=2972120 RepID=A0A9W9T798_9EURO|nr:Ribosomal RNA processing protein [Penicillium cf. griseofulvum]KAJ5422535.1 Ribosomal RNA processing protein [Penicillium cf. griseofulvum]KAJ5428712.1 Ribosomal RNA processing protein [Penicillium cf. griseofulvum]
MDGQKTPFVRELGSSDRKVRDKALESLTKFVQSRTDLTLVDLLKLWKGLFYCFYHSDRPLTQQALARALSYSLVPSLPQATLHRFLRAFWITIGRDYHSLDRIRLDKYLMLIRFYVGVAFEILVKNKSSKNDDGKKRKREDAAKGRGKKQKKQAEAETAEDDKKDSAEDVEAKFPDLAAYISIIEEGPLCPLNYDEDQDMDEGDPNYVPMPHGPDGLRYHLIDIWIDELEKVLEFVEVAGGDAEEAPKRKIKGDVPMELILRPLEKLRAESAYKPVRTRAAEALEDERLFEWGVRTRKDEDEDDSEEEWGGFE